MEPQDDILELLRKESAALAKMKQRALIIQPGAIGDCILTLPLASFMKEKLGLGCVNMLGHTEYIGILPGRSCVDSVSSIDAVDLHRLFVKPSEFELADRDPLLNVFSGYPWIVTFMGSPASDFEQNLIFTANCTHGSEVITLAPAPPKGSKEHVSEFYIREFVEQCGAIVADPSSEIEGSLMTFDRSDRDTGMQLLKECGVDVSKRVVVIHPGSGGKKKCWHLDNVLAVGEKLGKEGYSVVFLLGPAEVERFSSAMIRKIQSVGSQVSGLPLTQVIGLLACSETFIGNDSGITHLSAALGGRTIAMFGPTDPARYGPVGPVATTLKGAGRTFSSRSTPRLQEKLLMAVGS